MRPSAPENRLTPCAENPDMFFETHSAASVERAVALCRKCWFFDQCKEMGRNEEHGVWAGQVKRPPVPHMLSPTGRGAPELYASVTGLTAIEAGLILGRGAKSARRFMRGYERANGLPSGTAVEGMPHLDSAQAHAMYASAVSSPTAGATCRKYGISRRRLAGFIGRYERRHGAGREAA